MITSLCQTQPLLDFLQCSTLVVVVREILYLHSQYVPVFVEFLVYFFHQRGVPLELGSLIQPVLFKFAFIVDQLLH
jgi:hypothetical protein